MVDYISDFMERKKEQPFLVYYPMNLTHCPFVPTPHSEDWNPSDLGSKTYKGNPKYFADMVAYMDFSVGRIVDKIEQLGLSEDTILIFTADNGTDQPIVSMMGDVAVEGGKGKTTDNGTHVPLIVNWKGTVKAGFSNTALVDFSDFFPTLCEAADIKIDANLDLDGISFYPQLLGKDSLKRKWTHLV
jgi:arylsulfatase A